MPTRQYFIQCSAISYSHTTWFFATYYSILRNILQNALNMFSVLTHNNYHDNKLINFRLFLVLLSARGEDALKMVVSHQQQQPQQSHQRLLSDMVVAKIESCYARQCCIIYTLH